MTVEAKVVLDADEMQRALARIGHEIVEGNPDPTKVALVGIHSRGVPLAERLRDQIEEETGEEVPLGEVDISFYRDDVETRNPDGPIVRASRLEFDLTGRTVILIDDVMYTGRTTRAAIEVLFDYGRPERVQLAVIADRGHRQLPIRPDYVGKNLPTAHDERVNVRVEEIDGADCVEIAVPETAEAK